MRILLTRLDRLGDLILSTPAIRALRRAYPEAEITLACSERNAAVVEGNPDLDRVVVARGAADRAAIAAGHRGCDLAVALAPRTEDLRLVARTRAKRRLGYAYARRWGTRLYARLALTETLVSDVDPARCEHDPARPVPHEVEQLLRLAALAGGDVADPELVLVPDAAAREAAAAYPEGAIHLHLAPRWLARGSTEASTARLLAALRAYRRPVTVSYAPECSAAAVRLRASGFADAVVGDLTFSRWAALIGRAACVVTVDTSATHVASAMGRPTVVLFEHAYFALNAREWAPWGVPGRVLRKPATDDEPALARSRQDLVEAVGSLLPA